MKFMNRPKRGSVEKLVHFSLIIVTHAKDGKIDLWTIKWVQISQCGINRGGIGYVPPILLDGGRGPLDVTIIHSRVKPAGRPRVVKRPATAQQDAQKERFCMTRDTELSFTRNAALSCPGGSCVLVYLGPAAQTQLLYERKRYKRFIPFIRYRKTPRPAAKGSRNHHGHQHPRQPQCRPRRE